jgi:hypothetical protein
MPDDTKPPARGRPLKYRDPVTRTIQLEREDWDFAWEFGYHNSALGIQRALQDARRQAKR